MAAAAFDLEPIEHELHSARAQAGGAAATTMNLIVYVDDESLQARADARAAQLTEKYPARIIVLHTDREAPKVRSSVRKIGENALVHAERIELGIADVAPETTCSAINMLRVPDTANVLWWTSQTVAGERLFDELVKIMDTVIVDSSGASAKDFAIRELTRFFHGEKRVLLRDLAYMRLAPWQDMVAQFFDDQRFLDELHRIDRVEITSGSVAEGYYLVGWLASRLAWKPCGRFQLCDKADRAITFTLKPGGELRRVIRIALGTDDAEFSAELSESEDTVCLAVKGPGAGPPRCAPLHHIDNLSLLEKAFLLNNHDEVFEASLRILDELLQYDE